MKAPVPKAVCAPRFYLAASTSMPRWRGRVMPSLGLTFLFSLVAHAQNEPDQFFKAGEPKAVEAKAGLPVKLATAIKAAEVTWELIDEGKAIVIPQDDLKSPTFCWLVPTSLPFRLHAICLVDGKIQIERFVVRGAQPPTPPDPGPNPPPIPPPAPTNKLTEKLQIAYDEDAAAPNVKKFQLNSLTGLYQAMAEILPGKTDVKSTDALRVLLKDTADKMIAPGGLIGVRRVIGAELTAAIGGDTVPLTDSLRSTATKTFEAIAKSLVEVK